MRAFFGDIDRLLRGSYTSREDLRLGRLRVPIRMLVTSGLVLGALYGLFMGLYGVLRPRNPSLPQLLASTAKVPLLFLLTLAVTLPSLYVFSALSNSRLGVLDTLRLLLVAVAVNLALLASFGPVTAFFTLSTESYPFMVVLNVVLFAASGLAGLLVLRRALGVVFEPAAGPAPEDPEEEPGEAGPGATAPPGGTPTRVRARATARVKVVFRCWMIIYGAVGAQMGWILRPFIGSPDLPFTLFRPRESDFFTAFLRALRRLLL